MKFGLYGINSGPCADPEIAKAVAIAAEAAGFESLWTAEHVVLPDPQAPPSPAAPEFPILHPAVALAFIAGVTSTIKLATGIVLIAQRNPVILAKEMASVDVLSNGRLILGIGAGYLKAEFDTIGAPFAERGARTDEAIAVMRSLWRENPSFSGRFTSFSNIQSRPLPVQPGGPTIVVGGNSAAAYRRAVERCHGWYGFALDLETTRHCIDGLRAASEKFERPNELGLLEISVTPRARLSKDDVAAFDEAGVSRLILLQTKQTRDDLVDYVNKTAEALM